MADAVGRLARENRTDVEFVDDNCDWLVERYYPGERNVRNVSGTSAAVDEVPMDDDAHPDLTLADVRLRRPRGRPPKPKPAPSRRKRPSS